MDRQESGLWASALRNRLVDPATLESCWNAIPPQRRTPEAVDRRLARELVNAGALTLWQAQQLIRGRGRGLRVDDYLLLDQIGEGGMGTVYLAHDERHDRLVALKALTRERSKSLRSRARFDREIKVGEQLEDENLVRVLDHGSAYGYPYLIMDYIDGPTAGQLLSHWQQLPPPIAANICRQVALGMEHMHAKGLLHRDIKPSNIILTRGGVAKLSDMGLAFDLNTPESLTRDGAALGTLNYTSPEQALDSHAVDIRSDIYSLGCTLYHMIAGEPPFSDASLPELLLAHQIREPRALIKHSPACPAGLAVVISRMMAKAPGDRFARPAEVAAALVPFESPTLDADWLAAACPPPHRRQARGPAIARAAEEAVAPLDNQPFAAEWIEAARGIGEDRPPGPAPQSVGSSNMGDLFYKEESAPDLFLAASENPVRSPWLELMDLARAHAPLILTVAVALAALAIVAMLASAR